MKTNPKITIQRLLDFVLDMAAEKSLGAKKENDDENRKSDHIFPLGAVGNQTGGQGLENTENDSSPHGAGNVADPSQHGGREGFDAGHKTHVVLNGAIVQAVQRSGDAAECTAQKECQRNNPI